MGNVNAKYKMQNSLKQKSFKKIMRQKVGKT